jgi:hypothetical protein
VFGGAGRGLFNKPQAAKELEARLANGEMVTGFDALRERQHQALNEHEKMQQATGVDRDEAIINRLVRFGQGENPVSDEMLLKAAKDLGIENELRNIAGLAVYPKLRSKALLGLGSDKWWQVPFNITGYRADRALQLMSGQKNPFNRGGPLSDATERFFNLTGGTMGARYGNNIPQYLDQEEEQK